MGEHPKHIRKLIRQYATRAYEAELRRALESLALKFDEWRAGTRSNDDLSQAIHAFHQGPSRDTFKTYNELYSPLDMAVVHAIVTGILDEAEIEGDLLEHLAPAIQFYHEGG